MYINFGNYISTLRTVERGIVRLNVSIEITEDTRKPAKEWSGSRYPARPSPFILTTTTRVSRKSGGRNTVVRPSGIDPRADAWTRASGSRDREWCVLVVVMVVSHREPSISSNIRAIIEQLNLNPVERRRLIDKSAQGTARCKSFPDVAADSPPKITIGVYGCKERDELTLPGPIKPVRLVNKIDERSRSRAETRQRLAAAQIKWEARNEVKAIAIRRFGLVYTELSWQVARESVRFVYVSSYVRRRASQDESA